MTYTLVRKLTVTTTAVALFAIGLSPFHVKAPITISLNGSL